MIKLKKLKLVNFCGFRDFEIDLSDGDGIRKWTILYGPNGSNKSSFLDAIELLSRPWRLKSREDSTIFFRRLTFHSDYLVNYLGFDKSRTKLYMKATFIENKEEKEVVFENNWDPVTSGVTKDDFNRENFSACFKVDSDNPINIQKFQLVSKYKEQFLDFAKTVYGFDCELPERGEFGIVEEYDKQREEYINYYTDFIIYKYGTKVHYKSMSAGEKKIATMLTELFNNVYDREIYKNKILLIDNIVMHIYYLRHMKVIEKLDEFFPNNQIIATTHSPVIIKEMNKKYLVDMERYIGD